MEVKEGIIMVAEKARFGNYPELHGGYRAAADNSISNNVSFVNIKEMIEPTKEPGCYR
jgi:hypothetical protein